MPTREAWIKDHLQDKPNNLVIRFSAPMVDQRAPASWPNSSEVVNSNASCPAPKQNNECRDCQSSAGTPQLKQFLMVNIKTKFPRGIWIRSLAQEGATAHAKRAPGPGLKHQAQSTQAASVKLSNQPVQASSGKRQALQQASSVKPQAASSLILEPRNMDIEEVLGGKGPRAFTMINVFSG